MIYCTIMSSEITENLVQSRESLPIKEADHVTIDVVSESTSVRDYVQHIIKSPDNTEDDAFYVMNLSELLRVYEEWKKTLPRVHPFYAVKCNDDPVILKLFAALGLGFDCASKNEIEIVLSIGVSPERIIYANPCKQISHLKFAAERSIRFMTFDNMSELRKIKQYFPAARLILRVCVEDNSPFFGKFGCSVPVGKKLLDCALAMGLEVVGLSFHIGSGSQTPSLYKDTLQSCSEIFQYGAKIGYSFTILDLGGGFSDHTSKDLFDIQAKYINESLDRHFDMEDYSSLRIVAEPGRFMCNTAMTIATNIISVRSCDEDESPTRMYHLNDGNYGSFTIIFFEGLKTAPLSVTKESSPTQRSILWGPTLDRMDKLCETDLPELNVGDWIYFQNMGAYSNTLFTQFNKFSPPKFHYYIHNKDWTEKLFEL